MSQLLVDELVKALASLIEDASKLSCVEVCPMGQYDHYTHLGDSSVKDLAPILSFFGDLLKAGRDVESVELRSSDSHDSDWLEFIPTKGEILIITQTDSKRYTITIRQQSVHAHGGIPYGSH